MSALTEFLIARITEDEDRAKRAAWGWGAEWREETDSAEDWSSIHADGKRDMVGCEDEDVTRHIARHDPARVLAECAAKRAIVSACAAIEDKRWDANLWSMNEDERILATLAAVYAGHPDYSEEWS